MAATPDVARATDGSWAGAARTASQPVSHFSPAIGTHERMLVTLDKDLGELAVDRRWPRAARSRAAGPRRPRRSRRQRGDRPHAGAGRRPLPHSTGLPTRRGRPDPTTRRTRPASAGERFGAALALGGDVPSCPQPDLSGQRGVWACPSEARSRRRFSTTDLGTTWRGPGHRQRPRSLACSARPRCSPAPRDGTNFVCVRPGAGFALTTVCSSGLAPASHPDQAFWTAGQPLRT